MNTFNRRIVFAFVVASLALVTTAPANAAGGRSGAQASQQAMQPTQTPAQMQAEIEALRKQMVELKEQQALLKVSATSK